MSRADTYESGDGLVRKARRVLKDWEAAEGDEGRMGPPRSCDYEPRSKYDDMSDEQILEAYLLRARVRGLLEGD